MRQVLRYSKAPGIPLEHDSAHGELYAGQRVAAACPHLLHADLFRLVRHGRSPAMGAGASRGLCVCRQQDVRHYLQFGQLLDTRRRHDHHVLPYL